MQAHVPALDVQQASLQSVDIGQIGIGPISVGDLVVNNVDLTFSAGPAVLRGVVVQVTLDVTFDWSITIPLPWPFHDRHFGDTYHLGSFTVPPVPVGNVTIPSLPDVKIHVDSLTGNNASASAAPLTDLHLRNASADTVHASDVALPSAGFSIAGLLLNSIQGTALSVPAASLGSATVDRLHGDPAQIPQFVLGPVSAPKLDVPLIETTAPVDIPQIVLTPIVIHIPAGLLDAHVTIKPTASSHVDQLEINHAQASAGVGQVVLHNVVLPYEALRLTLSQVGITNIAIPAFNVA